MKLIQSIRTDMQGKLYLIRHGQTEWNVTGQHTSYTDLPLTEEGKKQAHYLKKRLEKVEIKQAISSPMKRAKETAKLAGFENPILDPTIVEWNYGEYEGITSKEIKKEDPDWNIFTHGAKGGESIKEVEDRANSWIAGLNLEKGNTAVFSHGHFLRVLGACWIGLGAKKGSFFLLTNASICVLGYHRKERVIYQWNHAEL